MIEGKGITMDREELGYLKAQVENTAKSQERQEENQRRMWEELKAMREETRKSVQELKDDVNMYKHIIRVVKALGATAVLVLTLKFGDISALWEDL